MKILCYAVLVAITSAPLSRAAERVTLEAKEDRVTVKVGGAVFTEYLVRSGAKPVLWPIVGPTGKRMTRNYPLETAAGEDQDHIHQRSMWFTHGKVDGIDFWSELPGHGTIEHRGFLKVESGTPARIETRNDWLGPDGKLHCQDIRRLAFYADADSRAIDFDIELRAKDKPVAFEDTKEGSFGLRMAHGLTVKSRDGVLLGGHIVNSLGQHDADTWGKRAPWVDYFGKIDGEPLGIAVLNHPASFRFPTYWHVRPYGLFAANPFGIHDFTGGESGTVTIKPGESLRLRYRVLLHKGDQVVGHVAQQFEDYARSAQPAEPAS